MISRPSVNGITFLTILILCGFNAFGSSLLGRCDTDGQSDKGDIEKTGRLWEKPLNFRYEVIRATGKKPEDVVLAPGYYELEKDTFHRWKGITFSPPSPYAGRSTRVLLVDSERFAYAVVEYDPVVSYLKLEDGKVAVGYYGLGRRDFYFWKAVKIEPDEIPLEAAEKLERVFQKSTFKGYIIDVNPPKHLLDKPELWKKVKKAEKK
jgi:hypothetical protein